MSGEDCVRRRVEIEGEYYYLLIGDNFLMATVPRENDPQQSATRKIVETLCNAVSEVRSNKKEE